MTITATSVECAALADLCIRNLPDNPDHRLYALRAAADWLRRGVEAAEREAAASAPDAVVPH